MKFDPLIRVHVENDHVLAHHAVLSLPPIDDHGALVSDSRVILAGADTNTLTLEHFYRASLQVVLQDLVRAFAHHSLTVELEATTEDIEFFLVLNRTVALAALDHLLRVKTDFLPGDLIPANLGFNDLFDRLAIHTADHVN